MKRWGAVIFFLLPVFVNAQIITNFAGTGSSVFSGEGVSATSAGIPNPNGGVFDENGNYYFADVLNSYRIRKVSATGIITTIAGTGVSGFNGNNIPATSAQLDGPTAVALDTSGNLYIVEHQGNRVRKVNMATGIIHLIAGIGSGSFAGDGGAATAANLYNPQDVCTDKHGNIYIADFWNNRIRKVDPAGTITTIAGGGTGLGDNGPATSAQLVGPWGLAIDSSGNVYLAEASSSTLSNRVRKIDAFGIITTVAGNGSPTYVGDGIPATAAAIYPSRITFDTSGQLYIAEYGGNRILRVDHSGIIHLVAGNGASASSGDGGSATAAAIWDPGGVAFDPCGNLYIADVGGRRLRKVTFNPTCDLETLNTEVTRKNENISIYPNPANEELHIDNAKAGTKYDVVSVVGAVVRSGTLLAKENNIPIKILPPGLYLLLLTDGEGGRTVYRVIKE